MPELDFMVVSDYVRAENGVLHMISGGVDTIAARSVPATRNIGIGLSLKVPRRELAVHHTIRIVFHGTDGARITEVGAELPVRADVPSAATTRAVRVVTALNMSLPLPAYGDYSLELLVNGNRKKEIPIYVIPAASKIGD
jgi:hypothetical protein